VGAYEVVRVAVAEKKVVLVASDLDRRGSRLMKKYVMDGSPLPDGSEVRGIERPECPVTPGTDVQEHVRAVPPTGDDLADDVRRGLVVDVLRRIPPVVAEGLAHLACHVLGRVGEVDGLGDAALEGHAVQLDVAELAASVEPRVVDENRVGLELPDQAVELVLVPVLVGVRPDAVEPEAADATVVGAE